MSKWFSATYAKSVVRGINAPFNVQVDLFLRAWAQAESGTYDKPGAVWNPFDTTQKGFRSTDYNSNNPPVQNYPSWQIGTKATVDTLLNGKYVGLVSAIRDGRSATVMGLALEASPWGTGGLVTEILTHGGPRQFPIGSCYPVPPTAYAHGTAKIASGSSGPDVDELLRHLGNVGKWYTHSDVGDPVAKVIDIQQANPKLGKADGIVGPVTYKFITGHA